MKVVVQMAPTTIYPRYAEHRLLEALEDSPVVLINGPRQCGKSTLARTICAPEDFGSPSGDRLQSSALYSGAYSIRGKYEYISLDDDNLRTGAQEDPVGFVGDLPDKVVLDEVQRAPELFTALKVAVDRNRTPGRFVLTGSSNILLLERLADSLAGRQEIVRLHPLSQGEIEAGVTQLEDTMPHSSPPTDFLGRIFGDGFRIGQSARLGRELYSRIVAGGFPPALARTAAHRRAAWCRAYAEAHVQRDVRDMARIRSLDVIPRLLNVAASQTARLFNLSELSAPFQLSRQTIGDYVTLLERVFLLEKLPPWHGVRRGRLLKTPKLHLGDTGLGCALLGLDEESLATNQTFKSSLLETFVYQELRRQASWSIDPHSFFYYRDKDQVEVDIVMERGSLAVAGVDIKASATVVSSDFRGLRKLKRIAGSRFTNGVVLYDGESVARFGDSLYAVPIRHLWK